MTVDFDISPTGYLVRPATVPDTRAIRMLMPDFPVGGEAFVAIDNANQRVIAAAGSTQSCRTQPYTGPGIDVRVIKPCRRHGIGTRLLACLENSARRVFAASALYAARRVEKHSDEFHAWQRMGFAPVETVEEHILPVAQFESRLGPLVDRLRSKGRIPSTARIIPLYQANPAAVLQLHLDQMGGDRAELYRKIRGKGLGAFHPRYSRVLLVDDKVKGCILAHRAAADIAAVDANIVDPSVRGGWANIWLKLEATRGAVRLRIKSFQFTTFDHYSDTRSFTEQLGGETTRTTCLMVRPIAPTDPRD